jgi:hypothetical protein
MILKKARVCKHCGHDVEPLMKPEISPQIPLPAPPEMVVEAPSPQPPGSKPVAGKPPQFRTISEPPAKMKFIVMALVALILIVAGVWYFSEHGKVRVNPKDGLKYVWIPPGTFKMGCSPGDNDCDVNEKPTHQVTITKGFWLGQTPVTVGAYKHFVWATGIQMPPEPVMDN